MILFFSIGSAVLIGTGLVVLNARQSVRNEIESSVHLAVELIESGIAAGLKAESFESWLRQLQNLGPIRHIRLELRQRSEMPDQTRGIRQNVARAIAGVPAWFVWSVTPEPMTFRQDVKLSAGLSGALWVRADPRAEISESWSEARDLFVLIGGMAAIVLVLTTITVERALKPVGVILNGLDDLEKGQYRLQLPEFSLPEFNRIGRSINQTAAVLESARRENAALRLHSLEVREQERQYLARELHDEFGQALSAIKAVTALLKNQSRDPSQREALESVQSTCDRLFSVLDNLLRQLHPLVLDDFGLQAALEEMIERWAAQQPETGVEQSLDPDIDVFPEGWRIQVYRIVQEALTNIQKHAEASRVLVSVKVDRDSRDRQARLRIELDDNGKGFDPASVRSGFGLRGIRERVESLGGELTIESAAGQGVRMKLSLQFSGNSA